MCAFYGVEIFSTPRLKNVYMCMDTDSRLKEPLCYDPFAAMHVRRRSYNYLSIKEDPAYVTVGRWGFVNNYALAHPSVAKQMHANKWEWPHESWPRSSVEEETVELRFKGYDNNFEIVNLQSFRRADARHESYLVPSTSLLLATD